MFDQKVKRGDIFLADLSPSVGSEQGGIRPVLIIQNDKGNHYSPTVIIAAITSQGKPNIPTHIFLTVDSSGLHRDSIVMLEQLRTLDKSRLRNKIGSLSIKQMGEIDRGICVSLGICAA